MEKERGEEKSFFYMLFSGLVSSRRAKQPAGRYPGRDDDDEGDNHHYSSTQAEHRMPFLVRSLY